MAQDNIVVPVREAARLAGYSNRQNFLLRVATAGGLTVRRMGTHHRGAVYFYREELMLWIELHPHKAKCGPKPKYFKSVG